MYADTRAIRHLAAGLRERAGDIRAEADALAGRAETCLWAGLAADAMRGRARLQASVLRRCADEHADAAEALEAHAAAVEDAMALIAAIERKAAQLVEGARSRVAAWVDGVADAVLDHRDEALAAFVPPPPGHPAWLKVELPGVTS